MADKEKVLAALTRFFDKVKKEDLDNDFHEIARNYEYTKDIFFSKFIRNPDDNWWYDIIVKNLSPCFDLIMSKYGSEDVFGEGYIATYKTSSD